MTLHPNESHSEFLFTYGTLQPGRAPAEIAPLVEKLQIAGRGYVHGTLYDFGLYPGAVLDPSSSRRIPGTIYRLPMDLELLAQLDAYEEYFPRSSETSQFIRERHPVYMEDGSAVQCWVYVFNESFDRRRIEFRGHHEMG